MVSITKGATLVIGATGGTGRHVVQQLLNQGRPVHVIVRSKERMLAALEDSSKAATLLTITEASFLDLTEKELQDHVKQVDNAVCCLGHNVSYQGIFGEPRRLVTDSVKRLTQALAQTTGTRRKLVVMNSVGVAHPAGSDDRRGCWERCLLAFFRRYLPPHADNEAAAAYLYHLAGTGNMEWAVVRPPDLVDGAATDYEFHDKPIGPIFRSGVLTRATVARCMVDLVTDEALFAEYKFRMPVLSDATQPIHKNSRKKDKKSEKQA